MDAGKGTHIVAFDVLVLSRSWRRSLALALLSAFQFIATARHVLKNYIKLCSSKGHSKERIWNHTSLNFRIVS